MPTTLDTLPPEVLYEILKQFPVHANEQLHFTHHPLLTLPLVSRTLHAATESFCFHQLQKLRAQFPHHKVSQRTPYRKVYVKHAHTHCSFCNRSTSCTAIIFPYIRCCRGCDRKVWPEKISLSAAKRTYGLPEQMLLARCAWGAYMCQGVWARMLLTPEVKQLAGEVHGDLENWLEGRRRKGAERRRKRYSTCAVSFHKSCALTWHRLSNMAIRSGEAVKMVEDGVITTFSPDGTSSVTGTHKP
ncbi:hypothetical protein FN846DRAFT_953628 [Sphaerosporella brunnea]|uniref:F-box domain-containing protein n=1 Tax=Sphaerosporella brunnea TaxID=1250544 RepID=A0A5J5EUQ5_9PEZI|nr:hypothetical protein FN846DRAFT_953628 [Sphaerosporella brunnea]